MECKRTAETRKTRHRRKGNQRTQFNIAWVVRDSHETTRTPYNLKWKSNVFLVTKLIAGMVLLSRKLHDFVTGYNPINDRIMTIRINCTPLPVNITQIYQTIENISKREILPSILINQGDWNAKVRSTEQYDHIRHILGKHRLGTKNVRGEMFIDFYLMESNKGLMGIASVLKQF